MRRGWTEQGNARRPTSWSNRSAIRATIDQLNRSKGEQNLQNRLQNPQSHSG